MDTRKLVVGPSKRFGILYDEEGRRVAQVGRYSEAIGTNEATAAELVRRWNAFPRLVSMVASLEDALSRAHDDLDYDRDNAQREWSTQARTLLETLKA